MTEPTFDRADQLATIRAGLLQNESLIAVYDAVGAGTGFIGLTDRRVILQDNSLTGRKVALTSIPYSRISAVSFVSEKAMLSRNSSSIAIAVGGTTYEVDFHGEQKAKHAHDVILWNMH